MAMSTGVAPDEYQTTSVHRNAARDHRVFIH